MLTGFYDQIRLRLSDDTGSGPPFMGCWFRELTYAANRSKIYYTNNFKTINPSFLLREIVANCGFVPPQFRLTCIAVGDLGIRRLGELGNEHSFWLLFQMDYAEGREQRDINWILCVPSHNLEFVTAMHIFLGVDPGKLCASIANKGPDFAHINMFRSRYANFLIDDDGSATVSGSGRDVIIPTLSYGLDEIESGAVGLPMGVRQLVEKYPKV